MTTGPYLDAVDYVGTTPISGLAQLALLQRLGLRRTDHVLEIGAGALHLAKALLCYSDPYRYYGMDPNKWLRTAAITADPTLAALVGDRGARFASRDDFDGAETWGQQFDVVVSHSVLSHTSRAQVDQFLAAVARALRPDGWALVSLNLATLEANMGDEWVYPGCVSVRVDDFDLAVEKAGLAWKEPADLRRLYRSWCPDETHDWVRLSRG